MATVTPTRLAPPPASAVPLSSFPPPSTPALGGVPPVTIPRWMSRGSILPLERIARYTILVAIIHPLAGIVLAIASLRSSTDAEVRRRAKVAIAVAAVAYVLYAVIMVLLVRQCIVLIGQLIELTS